MALTRARVLAGDEAFGRRHAEAVTAIIDRRRTAGGGVAGGRAMRELIATGEGR